MRKRVDCTGSKERNSGIEDKDLAAAVGSDDADDSSSRERESEVLVQQPADTRHFDLTLSNYDGQPVAKRLGDSFNLNHLSAKLGPGRDV
eukprot:755029-Hanusia_phi.AAC.19